MPCSHVARLVLTGVLAGALATATSHAAPADPIERARALFAQAESDEDAERWSEAIEKLRVVAQVKFTAGVRYHIALCEEHLGQLARALGDYRDAEDQARLENAQDVLRIVGKQVSALDPRVPRLTIRVVPPVPAVSLKLDGKPLDQGPTHAASPVDPGVHYVEATAPNRTPSAAAVTLREYESRVLDVSLSEPAPEPSTSPWTASASTSTPPSTSSTPKQAPAPRRGGAIAATTVAAALAGAGAAAFLIAGAEHDGAVRTCSLTIDPAPGACDGLKLRVRGWDFAAAGAWGGALVAATTAFVLWSKPGDDSATRVGATWMLGPMAAGVRGRF